MENAELLRHLAETPKRLAQLVVDASERALSEPGEGGWSARDVLAHLHDAEVLLFRQSLLAMAAGGAAQQPDLERWRSLRRGERFLKERLLGDFALQRQASLNLLEGIDPDAWRSLGGGEGALAALLRRWVRHDEEHFHQLEQLLGWTHAEALERRRRFAEEWSG